MGKTKYQWYGAIKKLILTNYYLGDTEQAVQLRRAMEETRAEFEQLPNGDLRIKAVDKILIKKTMTYEGVAQELNYERRMIQRWVTAYINSVGKKAGY